MLNFFLSFFVIVSCSRSLFVVAWVLKASYHPSYLILWCSGERAPTFHFHLGICAMHFIIPFGKFGLPYLGKATAAARAALIPSPTNECWVFSYSIIHQTLTWTTGSLTYVRDYSYACIYIYTQGLGTPTSQPIIFYSEKLPKNCCAPNWV